ncbi:glycosyltransferase [bacterium]|nr:glycosyltransferase [bacterium]
MKYPSVSVVIPLKGEEPQVRGLIAHLLEMKPQALEEGGEIREIILSVTDEEEITELPSEVKVVAGSPGRGCQMNRAAHLAQGEHLWFLHADSTLSEDTIPALIRGIQRFPEALLYFDLIFTHRSPLMLLNEVGVWLRSRVCGLPFGDQALCLSKRSFLSLSGFHEGASIGEDHLFAWKVKRHRIPTLPINSFLGTSARKYRAHGWLRVTLAHLRVVVAQAFAEIRKGPY